MPATVASAITGNTLFVPVDNETKVASRQPRTNARLVPSPPNTSTTAQSFWAICSAATMVSIAEAVPELGSASNRTPRGIVVSAMACLTMPCESLMYTKRLAPAAIAPITARLTIASFSRLSNTEAFPARRLISFPDAGLATSPTARMTLNSQYLFHFGNDAFGIRDIHLF